MSNKNLLLLNYYVQSNINCIINITKNMYNTSNARYYDSLTVKRVWEFWSSKSQAGQILYCTVLQMVRHCFNIYASIPIQCLHCLSTLTRRWALQTRYMLQCNAVNIMKGFEENISKKLSRFICIYFTKLLHAH